MFGEDVTAFTRERDWRSVRLRIGYLFQGGALFDSMTVAENNAFPMRRHSTMTGAEIAARVEEVNDRLEETEWMEMTVVTQGPDVVRDCEHLEETDDGEVCVQKLELGDVKIRYADPYLMIDDDEKVVRGWSSGDKKCPAYLASVATGPGGGFLLFEVRYDCDKAAPRLHVLKTR